MVTLFTAAVLAAGPVSHSLAALVPAGASDGGARDRVLGDFLTPGPDKARLVVESEGRPQALGVFLNELVQLHVTYRRRLTTVSTMNSRKLCQTPCTLYVPSGEFPLMVHGDKPDPIRLDVDVPMGGVRLRLRDPSWPQIVIGGVCLALSLLGGVPVSLGALVAGKGQDYVPVAVAGGATIGLVITGIVLLAINPEGARSFESLND